MKIQFKHFTQFNYYVLLFPAINQSITFLSNTLFVFFSLLSSPIEFLCFTSPIHLDRSCINSLFLQSKEFVIPYQIFFLLVFAQDTKGQKTVSFYHVFLYSAPRMNSKLFNFIRTQLVLLFSFF